MLFIRIHILVSGASGQLHESFLYKVSMNILAELNYNGAVYGVAISSLEFH